MKYNGVDIYQCKIFTVDKETKRLKFFAGAHKDKTADDFNTIEDIHKAISYCFWIMKNKTFPLCSKYAASAFIKDLAPKLTELEMKVREYVINEQEAQERATEESIKKTGTRYI